MAKDTFAFNPNQQYLFRRTWELAIGTQGLTGAKVYDSLRTTFDFHKNNFGTSNKGKIEVYNLSTESRNSLQKNKNVVRLMAGYNGINQIIFLGNITRVESKRTGADIITILECGDGESAIANAKYQNSYPAGTNLFQIVQDIAKNMNVDAGIVLGLPEKVFNSGYAITGSCAANLTKLLKGFNLSWSIQNGALQIVPVGLHTGDTAQVISRSTGMIGVPSFNDSLLKFTSLLNPRLRPDSAVEMVSENTAINGFYKINAAHFEGDTHDNKWQVSCECVQISARQVISAARGFDYGSAVTTEQA